MRRQALRLPYCRTEGCCRTLRACKERGGRAAVQDCRWLLSVRGPNVQAVGSSPFSPRHSLFRQPANSKCDLKTANSLWRVVGTALTNLNHDSPMAWDAHEGTSAGFSGFAGCSPGAYSASAVAGCWLPALPTDARPHEPRAKEPTGQRSADARGEPRA